MSHYPFSMVPQLSASPALANALDNAAGSTGLASGSGHVHTSRIQRTVVTLNSSGEATFTFSRTITNEPAVACLFHESANNQPLVIKVQSFANTGSSYTAVTIKAYRAQVVPQNLATLLLSAVFNVFAGSSLNGIKVSIYAAEVTA